MGNLLQTYSLNSGFKIRKQKPNEKFYPVPEKYITIQNSSGMGAKNYDYWLDVLEYIAPVLESNGYKIVQIGRDCQLLPHCVHYVNQTSFPQTNYVIRNSKLHLGNDSFACHLSDLHSVPLVALYGSTSPINHGPHFRQGKVKLIESHRNGKKPSFAAAENPKTINFIMPEEVANAVFELLDLKDRITQKTIFIGPEYSNHFIEIVPNVVANPQALNGQVPLIRCDYEYNEEILIKNLQLSKCSIITDKETPIEIYKQFKPQIQNINFKVTLDSNLDYIRKLRNLGIEVRFWSEDAENINEIRFKMLDIDLVHFLEYDKFEVEIPDGAKYCSNRVILSNGKIYPSKDAYLKDTPIESPQNNKLPFDKNSQDLRNELKYLKITLDEQQ